MVRQAKGDGKAHTVQDSIPFQNMFPDGLCRLEGGAFSKTIAFEDVNYRLAGPEDQRSIFESLCDFYNGYDPSIGVQVTLDSRSGGNAADEMFGITRQGNNLDPIRDEADPIPTSYSVEVSSAGVERELKRPSDFEKFMGSQVEVRHYQPVEGAKSHTGLLRGWADGAVTIDINGVEKTYQKAQVAQVRLSVTI